MKTDQSQFARDLRSIVLRLQSMIDRMESANRPSAKEAAVTAAAAAINRAPGIKSREVARLAGLSVETFARDYAWVLKCLGYTLTGGCTAAWYPPPNRMPGNTTPGIPRDLQPDAPRQG